MSGTRSDGSMMVDESDVNTDFLDCNIEEDDCEHDEGNSLSKDNHGDDVFQCKKCHFFNNNKGGMKTHQTRIHKASKPHGKKRAFDQEADNIEHEGCSENDHNDEKKIRQDFITPKHHKIKASIENNTEKKAKILEESRLNESFLREWDDKEINAVSTQVDVLAEIFNKYEAEEQQNENASEITMDQFERTAKE